MAKVPIKCKATCRRVPDRFTELGAFDAERFLHLWAQTLLSADAPSHWHVVAWADHPPKANELHTTPLEHIVLEGVDAQQQGAFKVALREALAAACWGLLPGLHRLRLRVASHPLVQTHLTLGIGPVATREAERGFNIEVLDQGTSVAAGASGLPVGLVAPHASPDDSLISRLSRAGVRAMRDTMQQLLEPGIDWGDSGVQERRLPGKTRKGGAPQHWETDWPDEGHAWTCRTTDPQLPANTLWHARGAWVRPAALVRALLQHPRITCRTQANVTQLQRTANGWQALHAQTVLSETDHVIVATGWATVPLLAASALEGPALPMRPVRGQLSWGLMSAWPTPQLAWPSSPVNGNGCFIHSITTDEGPAWFAGSTFDRERDTADVLASDHAENLARVQALLPEHADTLTMPFVQDAVRGWAAVRCSVPDRLPMVGPLPHAPAGLWLCSAMGSRGLSLSVLCAELLAAQWCGEPLPLEPQLAKAISSQRFIRT